MASYEYVTVTPYIWNSPFFSSVLHQFPEYDELYCNYSFVCGQDWAVVSVSITTIIIITPCTATISFDVVSRVPIRVVESW